MQDDQFLEIVLPGILVLLACMIFVGAFIRADLRAQKSLLQARSQLFGDDRPLQYQSIWFSSWNFRFRNHARYIDYHHIHRQAAIDGLKQMRRPTFISGALVFLSWVCREVASAMA